MASVNDIGPAIERAVLARQGRREGRELRFLCPAHRDNHPSARWHSEKQVWRCDSCAAGGGRLDLARRLDLLDGVPSFQGVPVAKPAKPLPRDLIARLWRRGSRIDGTLAERYLQSRGLGGPWPESLRFIADLRHAPSNQRLPAMVAAITRWPSRELVAIHRTYLLPDGSGKARVSPARMALGPVSGTAIHLAPAGPVLAIAEGIETAFSIQQTTGIPTWAAISAGNLPALVLPDLPLAAELVIGADPDRAGLRYSQAAAELWHALGRAVRIAVPPVGSDFNDLLRAS